MSDATKRDLLDRLPRYYDASPEVDAIMTANAAELDRKRTQAREVLAQFFVSTAGTHGLAAWERVLALPPRPNATDDFRRKRILARLNGTAPATVRYLTDVVNVHVAAKNATIVEYPADYRFEAQVPASTTPINTTDIRRDVDEVKPAHLAFDLAVVGADTVTLTDRVYDYGVPYRICNTFRTEEMAGMAVRDAVAVTTGDYAYAVNYPVCGVLNIEMEAG